MGLSIVEERVETDKKMVTIYSETLKKGNYTMLILRI